MLRWYSMSTLVVEGRRPARRLGDHRVVDDQLDRHQRVDLGRVAAEGRQRVAHGGQVDHAGTPVKSCMSTRSGVKAISAASSLAEPVALGTVAPPGHRLDVGGVDGRPSSWRRRFSRTTFIE